MALKNLFAADKGTSACGSACGSNDKPTPSACGTGEKEEPKPSACGTACGAPDKK